MEIGDRGLLMGTNRRDVEEKYDIFQQHTPVSRSASKGMVEVHSACFLYDIVRVYRPGRSQRYLPVLESEMHSGILSAPVEVIYQRIEKPSLCQMRRYQMKLADHCIRQREREEAGLALLEFTELIRVMRHTAPRNNHFSR